MASFVNLKASVRAVLRDSPATFITDGQIGEWLNEAYLDLCARIRINRQEVTGTTSATGTVPFPSDYIDTEWMTITPTGEITEQEVDFTNNDVFDSWRISGGSLPPHILAREFDEQIETFPVQDSRPYKLRYTQKPVKLTADGDIPVIPEELHIRLINYARAHAKWMEYEDQQAERYWALYMEGLPTAPLGIKRERPAITSFVPVPDYWD